MRSAWEWEPITSACTGPGRPWLGLISRPRASSIHSAGSRSQAQSPISGWPTRSSCRSRMGPLMGFTHLESYITPRACGSLLQRFTASSGQEVLRSSACTTATRTFTPGACFVTLVPVSGGGRGSTQCGPTLSMAPDLHLLSSRRVGRSERCSARTPASPSPPVTSQRTASQLRCAPPRAACCDQLNDLSDGTGWWWLIDDAQAAPEPTTGQRGGQRDSRPCHSALRGSRRRARTARGVRSRPRCRALPAAGYCPTCPARFSLVAPAASMCRCWLPARKRDRLRARCRGRRHAAAAVSLDPRPDRSGRKANLGRSPARDSRAISTGSDPRECHVASTANRACIGLHTRPPDRLAWLEQRLASRRVSLSKSWAPQLRRWCRHTCARGDSCVPPRAYRRRGIHHKPGLYRWHVERAGYRLDRGGQRDIHSRRSGHRCDRRRRRPDPQGISAGAIRRPHLPTAPAFRTCRGGSGDAVTRTPLFLEYNGRGDFMVSDPPLFAAQRRLCERAALHAAARVVVVSEVERKRLVREGVDVRRIIVCPNGVDAGRFATGGGEKVRQALHINASDQVIGFVGTFGPWHGATVLAEAFVRLAPRAPDARLLLVGDGLERPAVETILAAHHVSQRVILAGKVPSSEVPSYLDACDILASPHVPLPADEEFFGSPTKLFEYMAAAQADRSQQAGADRATVLEDGDTGLLVTPGSVEELNGRSCGFSEIRRCADRIGSGGTRDRRRASQLGSKRRRDRPGYGDLIASGDNALRTCAESLGSSASETTLTPTCSAGCATRCSIAGPMRQGCGLRDDRTVGLGHRRLSIVDLDAGHQPMSSPDGDVVIVYNGEVYNHVRAPAGARASRPPLSHSLRHRGGSGHLS